MGMEFYGDDFNGPDVAPFVGINTFLHLPLIKNRKELIEANPDVAIIGEPFDFGLLYVLEHDMVLEQLELHLPFRLLLLNDLILKPVQTHLELFER